MRTPSIRTRIICVLAFCMLVFVVAVQGGSAHAAQSKIPVTFKGVTPQVDPNAVITGISVTFHTHNDNKDANTAISVLVQEPVGIFRENLAGLTNFAGSTQFGDNPPSDHTYNLTLTSNSFKLSDLTSEPTYTIVISPHGNDTWIFDASFTITLSDGTLLSTTPTGFNLSQNNQTGTGVFN